MEGGGVDMILGTSGLYNQFMRKLLSFQVSANFVDSVMDKESLGARICLRSFKKMLFINLFLAELGLCCCVGFSLVAASGGYSQVGGLRLLTAVALLLQSTGSKHAQASVLGVPRRSSCGVWAQLGFPGGSAVKKQPANAGDTRDVGSIPGLGRSPGGGHGNPLQGSCLESPMDRGAWLAAVHSVNLCLLHWQMDSLLLSHPRTPANIYF